MRFARHALLVASLTALAACGGSATPPVASPAGAAAVKAPGEAQVGDTSKCPVSGEEFVVAADSPKVDYEGKTYYFCCSGCAKKFQADPKKFLPRPTT